MATKKVVKKSSKKVERVLRKGNKVLIRTVSYFLTGEIVHMDDKFLLLKDSAWVADTGRFNEALKTGVLNEVEPVYTEDTLAEVSLGAIVDSFTWDHPLPREVK